MHIPITGATPDAYPTPLLDLFLEKGGPHPGEGSQLQQWSSFIGIVTAIVGNILISFALNTQRYAHILIGREYEQARKSYANGGVREHPGGYGSDQQDIVGEERRTNLGISDRSGSADDVAAISADETAQTTLQPDFGPWTPRTGRVKDLSDDLSRRSYLKSPYWWFGLVLMILGEAGNFLAYGFAPASIVSPLGVVALISNCLIAPLMLKERFRKRDLWGVLTAIAGAVTVVLSARTSEEKFGPGEIWQTIKRWEFLVYFIITLLLIVGLMYAEPRHGRKTILIDLGLVGLFGGYTVLSTKGVASLLSASLWKAFGHAIFYFLAAVLVGSALMQIRYLNRALQNYDSTQVIPIQFVLFTLSVIIGSAVLYRDFEHTTAEQAVKFIIGCLLTFWGVYLITSARDEETAEDGQHNADETIQLLDEDTGNIDERTPLNRDTDLSAAHTREEHPVILGQDEVRNGVLTPRRLSKASSSAPSIAATPLDSSEILGSNPWLSSVEQIDAPLPPRTPRTSRIQTDSGFTPFFTPATSKSDLETPSKQGTPRPPSPIRPTVPGTDDASPSPSYLNRSARGSISRLLPVPGPLLPPLSSSLSAVVAESLLKGEGTPRSVRTAMRRSRSARHSHDEHRRAIPVSDEENPASLNFQSGGSDQDLSSAQTQETMTVPVVSDYIDGSSEREHGLGKRKTRLRALSETLAGMMGKGKGKGTGKKRDDVEDYPSATNGGRRYGMS
ncbi:uncharacterized protein Z518_01263 [Rhinocladiella mackenziei CBS 650.93]|uniref:DUF803 domain membrane protein n=1 Tax=Rhinocladiella mackenziei CBS 650.93 TaxID=1442369 RepID=A0A0D2G5M2_9EURO|nr:uncharacterized protein Z518_01263 [Rhinocladiella mackenziei CBS 650.93]KIX10182.1 hypothetical protein Z518_01263 [Rhinocladiella mackenziei CBS 650.93]